MENKQVKHKDEQVKARIKNALQPQPMSKKTAQVLFGLGNDEKVKKQ